jgi:uncharacterized hydrophobic protein (TIGR00271 family)
MRDNNMEISDKITYGIDELTCKDIRNNSTFNWSFFLMNTLATIIACYGLLGNSSAVIIGAMIIAMLLGPITGMGLAIAESDITLFRKSITTLTKGSIVVVATAFIVGMLNQDVPLTNEIIVRTSPNIFDLMIALSGGAAGAYTIITPRLNAGIVGVAISTALVPPLSAAGILLSRGEVTLSMGAVVLFFTNMVAIQFATSVILWTAGIKKTNLMKSIELKKFMRRNLVSIFILIVLGIILSSNLHQVLITRSFEESTKGILEKEISSSLGCYLIDATFEKNSNVTIVRAVMRGPSPPSAKQVGIMENNLPAPPDGTKIELRIRFIETSIITENGLLYSDVKFSMSGE